MSGTITQIATIAAELQDRIPAVQSALDAHPDAEAQKALSAISELVTVLDLLTLNGGAS